jgi:nucleotide-binding universal stress UspA family protein
MRIILATDGSNDATAAAKWLTQLPLPADREVLVLSVVRPPLLPSVPDVTAELRTGMIEEAGRLADETAAGIPHARGTVLEGDPRDEIVATAETWGADLVVVGARGLGAIQEFLLGSVSLGVAHHAPCPVLICKGTPRPVRLVTVALDGSDHARRALDWLAALPLDPATRVRLIGVVEPERYPSTAPGLVAASLRAALASVEAERHAALKAALAAAVPALRQRVANADVLVVTGKPADFIVHDARRTGSDLIVLGARGLGMVKRLVLGSVSEAVARHAGCPVLIVRP